MFGQIRTTSSAADAVVPARGSSRRARAGMYVAGESALGHVLTYMAAGLADQLLALLRTADLTPAAQDTLVAYTSPHAALDAILSSARHLIFEFDGPICGLTAAIPRQDTLAGQLRALITAEGASLPATITSASRPAEILSAATAISPDVAAEIDAHLTHAEVTAAHSARPAAYVHDAPAACRDSGRNPAILSYHAAPAVTDYLTRRSLTEQAGHVTTLPAYPPGHLHPAAYLLEEAIRALGTTPEECALITASPASADRAHSLALVRFTARCRQLDGDKSWPPGRRLSRQ